MEFKDRIVVGLTEKITVCGKSTCKSVIARIDTGATKSSIDAKMAADLDLGPVVRQKLVKSATGNSMRPVKAAKVVIQDKELDTDFTIADRSHMKYSVLIGQDVLKQGFLIDPNK